MRRIDKELDNYQRMVLFSACCGLDDVDGEDEEDDDDDDFLIGRICEEDDCSSDEEEDLEGEVEVEDELEN